jgi:hypothetical protein
MRIRQRAFIPERQGAKMNCSLKSIINCRLAGWLQCLGSFEPCVLVVGRRNCFVCVRACDRDAGNELCLYWYTPLPVLLSCPSWGAVGSGDEAFFIPLAPTHQRSGSARLFRLIKVEPSLQMETCTGTRRPGRRECQAHD